MTESHVCGQYTTHKWGGGLGVYSPRKFLNGNFPGIKCHFLHSEHPNLLQNVS